MKKTIVLLFLTAIYSLSIGCKQAAKSSESAQTETSAGTPSVLDDQNEPTQSQSVKGKRNSDNSTAPSEATGNIPAKVYKVLKHIRENGEAPEGYVGGRVFQNRERNLASKDKNGQKIKYQEWDVNPKKRGKNRGAERLVTGSDGSAWYTNDHYQSFIEVKDK
jgi:guanyl-specific ribonuclease Sa